MIKEWGRKEGSLEEFIDFCRKDVFMATLYEDNFPEELKKEFNRQKIDLWSSVVIGDNDNEKEKPFLKDYLYQNPEKLTKLCELLGGTNINDMLFDYKLFLHLDNEDISYLTQPQQG